MPGEAAHVEFEAVSKHYRRANRAINELNLRVGQGEFLTLLGPTGAGKTTLLMMLAGLERPSSGTVRIGGRAIDTPAHRRNIGAVFQECALFPHMTVAENVAFPLEARGLHRASIPDRVEQSLAMVGLEQVADWLPEALAGGQRQRAAIARALVFEPALLVMDEPLAALDRRERERMQHEIRRIQRMLRLTVVYATHDQEEAMAVSDRVAVLRDGVIEQVATPEVLYEEPQRPFVAKFIGDSNLLHGRVAATDGDYCDVDVGDETVSAFLVSARAVGEPVVLAVPPERVGISATEGSYSNEFTVGIEDIVFQGDHLLLRTTLFGDPDFVLKIPNVVGHGAMLAGDQVRIGWASQDCRALLPDEEGAIDR